MKILARPPHKSSGRVPCGFSLSHLCVGSSAWRRSQAEKRDTGKCGGRKRYLERNPDAVALAKKLARYPVNGNRRSLRDVAAELERRGHLSAARTRYSAKAVARMVAT